MKIPCHQSHFVCYLRVLNWILLLLEEQLINVDNFLFFLAGCVNELESCAIRSQELLDFHWNWYNQQQKRIYMDVVISLHEANNNQLTVTCGPDLLVGGGDWAAHSIWQCIRFNLQEIRYSFIRTHMVVSQANP